MFNDTNRTDSTCSADFLPFLVRNQEDNLHARLVIVGHRLPVGDERVSIGAMYAISIYWCRVCLLLYVLDGVVRADAHSLLEATRHTRVTRSWLNI